MTRKYTKRVKTKIPKKEPTKIEPKVEIKEISKPKIIEEVKSKLVYGVEGKFLHIKVGDKNMPAEDTDIERIRTMIEGLLEDNKVKCLVFVTHHAVEINVLGGESSTITETVKEVIV